MHQISIYVFSNIKGSFIWFVEMCIMVPDFSNGLAEFLIKPVTDINIKAYM